MSTHKWIFGIILLVLVLVSSVAFGYGPLDSYRGYEAYWYEYSGYTYPYRLLYPHNYDSNKSYPLFVVMPGSGGVSDDNINHVTIGTTYPYYIRGGDTPSANYTNTDYECFVLSFQPPGNMVAPIRSEPIDSNSNYYPAENGEGLVWGRDFGDYVDWPMTFRRASGIFYDYRLGEDAVSIAACCGLISAVIYDANFTWYTDSNLSSYETKTANRVVNIDPNCVYVGGHSYGSVSAWQCLLTNPHLWAAAMPGDGSIASDGRTGLAATGDWWNPADDTEDYFAKYRNMVKRVLERTKHIPVLQYITGDGKFPYWPELMSGCQQYRNSLEGAADFLYNEGYYIGSNHYFDSHDNSTKKLLNDGVISGSNIWTVRVSEANQVSAMRLEPENVNNGILRPLTWLFQQTKAGRTWEDDPYPTPYLDAEPEDIPLDYIHHDYYLKWWKSKPMRYNFIDPDSRAWFDIDDVIYEMVEDGNELIWDKGGAGEYTFTDVNEIITPVTGPNGFRVQYEGAFDSAGDKVYHAFALLLPYNPNEPNFVDKRAVNPSPAIEEFRSAMFELQLSWTAGPDANSHDVYFGICYDSIIDANRSSSEFKGNQTATTFTPDANDLVFRRTHYWRIDEVDANDVITKGRIWRFFYNEGGVNNLTTEQWYGSIQNAIDDANDGNVLEVWQGTYHEIIDFKGKAITVRSTDPDNWEVVENTIIDAPSNAVIFKSGEDCNSILSGLTVTGGGGVGISFENSSSGTVRNCIISNHSSGINSTGSPVIENCKIYDNNYKGITCSGTGSPVIKNNWIYGMKDPPYGIGIDIVNSSAVEISNNTITSNAVGIHSLSSTEPNITNCIIWGNDDDLLDCNAVYSCVGDSNDLGDVNTTHNICADPCFAGANANDFHLLSTSPCIDVGNPDGDYTGQTDIDGQDRAAGIVDMGADELDRVYNQDQDSWYSSIQSAINGSSNGDEIVVSPSTYYENISFNGKTITVRGSAPNNWETVAATIIDGSGDEDHVVLIWSEEGSFWPEEAGALLEGLTIRGGGRDGGCSAVWCHINATIRKCIVENNEHGIECGYGRIAGNIIRNNSGAGINSSGTFCIIKNNIIFNNAYGITQSSGTGDAQVINNTIVNNLYGGIYCYTDYGAPVITNCILWGNGDDLYNCSATYSYIEDCHDIGTPNMHNCCGGDLLFVDADANDFHLSLTSPCINAGAPGSGSYWAGAKDIDNENRIWNSRIDIGADEVLLTYVEPGESIQDAIDNANNNSVIVVYPGTYYETINFNGKAITVRSTSPDNWYVVEATVIDASGYSYGARFNSGEDANSILTGFTICHSTTGVSCSGSSGPKIEKCIIENVSSIGISIVPGTSPKILNNIIRNSSYGYGIQGSSSGSVVIKNNWIYNMFYGIYLSNSPGTEICNNTITGCSSIGICGFGTTPVISNCIIWDCGDDLSGCSATYSCIEDGDSGTGNISSNPLFVDDANDNYHLDPNSPCIDVGDPNGTYTGQTDIDGDNRVIDITGKGDDVNDVDIGADEYGGS